MPEMYLVMALIILYQAALPVSCQINWNISASPNKCILENQEVKLICSYAGAPGEVKKGIWLKNGEEMYYFDPLGNSTGVANGSDWEGRTDVVYVGKRDTSFEIKFRMGKADEGVYTCNIDVFENAQKNSYSTEKNISLYISVPPERPRIHSGEGKLVCTSTGGVPPPTFTWTRASIGTVESTNTTSTIAVGRSIYACQVNHCTTGEMTDTAKIPTCPVLLQNHAEKPLTWGLIAAVFAILCLISIGLNISSFFKIRSLSRLKEEIPTCPVLLQNHAEKPLTWGLIAAVFAILCLISIGLNISSFFKIRSLSRLKEGKPDHRKDHTYENIHGSNNANTQTDDEAVYDDTDNTAVNIQTPGHQVGNVTRGNIGPYEKLIADRGGGYENQSNNTNAQTDAVVYDDTDNPAVNIQTPGHHVGNVTPGNIGPYENLNTDGGGGYENQRNIGASAALTENLHVNELSE